MLKRISCIVVIIVGVIIMSSCISYQDRLARLLMSNDEKKSIKRLEQVLDALEDQDAEALKSLFSQKALEETESFEENVDALFELFQGEILTKEKPSGPTVYEGHNDGYSGRWKEISSYYYVQTDKERYFFLMKDYPVDTSHPDNVGLYLLLVVKENDESKIWDESEKIIYDIVDGEIVKIPRSGVYIPFR